MTCNCDIEHALGPCATHRRVDYLAWLTERAPRLAVAEAQGDPFVNREYWPPDAAEIEEFAAYRAALSGVAREHFDRQWESEVEYVEWPSAWETALIVRDAWPTLVAAQERDALRARLAQVGRDEEYPIGRHGEDYEEFPDNVASAEWLIGEADKLGVLAARALHMEQVLREHAAEMAKGGSGVPVVP
ncbi:hypothetical protein [Streptosporangium jomthongense]|uniref:Uncharacterized protein n=1 Tax=Streptosporangium jomthongense TaxID=1193683 RepID=A0ABV8EWH5_9ACTN